MDSQADLSLRCAHTHFVGFIMSWLICCSMIYCLTRYGNLQISDLHVLGYAATVLDKINNENRQTRCIVYGQHVQMNYRSILSGVKSVTRKRNFHICKHVEANTFAAIRLDCSMDTFYYNHNISIVDLSPLGFLALECEKRNVAQCDIWLHFCLPLVLN